MDSFRWEQWALIHSGLVRPQSLGILQPRPWCKRQRLECNPPCARGQGLPHCGAHLDAGCEGVCVQASSDRTGSYGLGRYREL